MLNYLESDEEVPESELDLMNVRDNLKLAEDASGAKNRHNMQLKQLEKFLTHWKSKVEDKVGLKAKKEVSLLIFSFLKNYKKDQWVVFLTNIVIQELFYGTKKHKSLILF